MELDHHLWNEIISGQKGEKISNVKISVKHDVYRYKKYFLIDAHKLIKDDIKLLVKNIIDFVENPIQIYIFIMTGYGSRILYNFLAPWKKIFYKGDNKYNLLSSKVFCKNGYDRDDMIVLNFT